MQRLNIKKLNKALSYIDSWLKFNFRNSTIPGLTVAIQHNSEILLSEALGYSNLSTNTKLKTSSLMRIGSISKVITATAVMRLVEEGRLKLDDKVVDHLGWFDSKLDIRVAKITIRQLLSHSSGLCRDGENPEYWMLKREFPLANELIKYIGHAKLTFNIDEYFKYSNIGYAYLGMVVEKVTGTDFNEYIKEHFLAELNLSEIYPDVTNDAENQMAFGHASKLFDHAEYSLQSQTHSNSLSAATGFCSSARDLCNFLALHFLGDNKLISDTSKSEMQHSYWSIEEERQSYGYGVVIFNGRKYRCLGHNGSFPGFSASAKFDPMRNLAVTVLTNNWHGPVHLISDQILNIINFFQEQNESPKDLHRYEGRFFSTLGVADIIAVNGQLIEADPSNWGGVEQIQKLDLVDCDTFKIESVNGFGYSGEKIVFIHNSENKSKAIIYSGMYMTQEKEFLENNN